MATRIDFTFAIPSYLIQWLSRISENALNSNFYSLKENHSLLLWKPTSFYSILVSLSRPHLRFQHLYTALHTAINHHLLSNLGRRDLSEVSMWEVSNNRLGAKRFRRSDNSLSCIIWRGGSDATFASTCTLPRFHPTWIDIPSLLSPSLKFEFLFNSCSHSFLSAIASGQVHSLIQHSFLASLPGVISFFLANLLWLWLLNIKRFGTMRSSQRHFQGGGVLLRRIRHC